MSENIPEGKINTPEHSKTVYDIAAESIVLLKNEKKLITAKYFGDKKYRGYWRQCYSHFSPWRLWRGSKSKIRSNRIGRFAKQSG